MSNAVKSPALLDALLESITRDPKRFLWVVLICAALWLSVVGVLLSLLLWPLRVLINVSILWWIGIGLFLILVSMFLIGISFAEIHTMNRILFLGVWHQHDAHFSFYHFFCALPYGVLESGIWILIFENQSTLQRQLKQLQRGQSLEPVKKVPEKTQQYRLTALTHAAYHGGTILGIDQYSGAYAVLSDHLANLHTLLVGTTGSGKTTTLGNVIESAIFRGLPLFCIDGKGDLDLAIRVRNCALAENRPFYLFSMIGESVKYNPIASGGFTAKKDRLIELRQWSEDHYRKLAEGYLQTVFRVLEYANIPLDLFTLARYLKPDALYNLVSDHKDKHFTAEVHALEDTYPEMQSLIAEIQNITRSEIGSLFDCQSGVVLTLEQALKEKAIVYFCLQPLAFPAYAELLGKVIINDLKGLLAQQLSSRVANTTPIYCLFDEFSTFAGEQMIHLINQGRGAGAHVILSTQSLSDLVHKGGEAFLGQVLNNVNHYIIQRQNNPEDAERLASIIGTVDDFQLTSQLSTENVGSINGSIRSVKSFIVHPDQIKRLRLGEAILVNKQNFSVQWVTLRRGKI